MTNIQEAYKMLGVSEDISDDELKIKYKELARKFHPDIFKDDPDKFKKINESYQLVQDYRQNPNKYTSKPPVGFWNNVVDLGSIFFNGNFSQDEDEHLNRKPIKIDIRITFHEAVQGCSKEISYNRNIKCSTCKGEGYKSIGNNCDKCDGFGRTTSRHGNAIFQSACIKCRGKGIKREDCQTCYNKKTVSDARTGNINIPAGSQDQDVLRLADAGNYIGRHMFGDAHSDVHIYLIVEKYKNFSLQEQNVVSELTISLVEALEGCSKEIETVYGIKEINILPKSKHSDQIKISECGVKDTDGLHIVKLNVEYPEHVTQLIEVMKNGVSNTV